MEAPTRSLLRRYGTAIVTVLVATGACLLLDPLLEGHLLFSMYLVAILVTEWYSGFGPSLLALVLGTAASDQFFVLPHRPPAWPAGETPLALSLFFSLGLAGTLICEAQRAAQRRAEAGKLEALRRQQQLEQEIRQRHEAEQTRSLLVAIVESSEDAIISRSLKGTILTWNAGAERLYGYSADEVVGKSITLLFPSDRTGESVELRERIRNAETIPSYETMRVRKDGTAVDVAVSASPISNATGQVIGLATIARDITERKRWREALKEADRRKDEFLAMLAHELRNPLAPLRNAVQILQAKASTDPEAVWSREVIGRQVQHMTRLVDDLLDVSRIPRGKLELRKQRVELVNIVEDALETSRPLIKARGIALTVCLPPESVFLEADPTRLTQVFLNLLNNAAKYTEEGGHIWLSAEQRFGEVVVTVKDDGVGIAADMLPRIFDLFVQTAPDRSQGGMGVGLSLVKGLVELHGGWVEARSDGPGRGSQFIVHLPVTDEKAGAEVPAGPHEPGISTGGIRRRILVVDDNRDGADSLAMTLQTMGHDVRTAYDGQAGVEAAASFRPEVVLLDLSMPRLDGYKAARCIREQPWGKNLVLIALTGWGQEEDRHRCEHAGFNFHLLKPVEPETVTNLLADLPREELHPLVRRCSWCQKIERNQVWLNIEEAAKEMGLPDARHLSEITDTICPDCYRKMMKDTDATLGDEKELT